MSKFVPIHRTFLLFCFLLLLNCGDNPSKIEPTLNDEYSIYITGKLLTNNNTPFSNAIVTLIGNNLSDTTDSDGRYTLYEKKELKKTPQSNDTSLDLLEIKKDDQIITYVSITNLLDSINDLFFIQRNISGKIDSTKLEIGRIEAKIAIVDSIYKMQDTILTELWFNSEMYSYSGFVYFLYTASTKNYSIFINVYNDDTVFTGRSKTITFPSTAGDIEMPSINSMNAFPEVIIDGDSLLKKGALLNLHVNAKDSFGGKIMRYEWSINNSPFKEVSHGDTSFNVPETDIDSFICISRVFDNDENCAYDTLVVTIGYWVNINIDNLNIHQGICGSYNSVSICLNSQGSPFIAFTDGDYDKKISAINCIDDSCSFVGERGFSDESVFEIKTTTKDQDLFVSCLTYDNYKLSVFSYRGNEWIVLGEENNSGAGLNSFDITINNANFLVCYSGFEAYDGKAVVMQYIDDEWMPLGEKPFTPNTVTPIAISIYEDTYPIVAFGDASVDYKLTVMGYRDNSWGVIGKKGFSQDQVEDIHVEVNKDNQIFVSCADEFFNYGPVVYTLIDSSWKMLGDGAITEDNTDFAPAFSMAIDTTGAPVIAYFSHNQNKLFIKRYYNSEWNDYCGKPISIENICNLDIIINSNNDAYLTYTQNNRLIINRFQ